MLFKVISVFGTVAGFLMAGSAFAIQADQIAPPDVKFVDDMGVNLSTGQVAASVNTVSIGGDLGLSHSISMHANHFSATSGSYGYTDRFSGSARYENIGDKVTIGGTQYRHVHIMRVFGPGGSKDFKVMVNGQFEPNLNASGAPTSGYTYRALGDTRHLLEVVSGGDLVWTRPDGTELFYKRTASSVDAISRGRLAKVVYPNGFTLRISRGNVSTNTGYQLKYEFDSNATQGLSSAKQSILNSLPSSADIPASEPQHWANTNPMAIRAVNRAVEFCSEDPSTNCNNLTHEWPKAQFSWPGGMPRAVYLGDSIFSVENATGGVTDFHFQAQDVTLEDVNDPSTYVNSPHHHWNVNEKWSPRLVGIKPSGSAEITREYQYKNVFEPESVAWDGDGVLGVTLVQSFWTLSTYVGQIKHAKNIESEVSYSTHSNYMHIAIQGNGYRGNFRVENHARTPGTFIQAYIPKSGQVLYESGFRNFVDKIIPVSGPTKDYKYDSRGNLRSILENNVGTTASYPSECGQSTRKTCNQPEWVEDANGSRTDYTYHEPSGQIETITSPPSSYGRRPQRRYEYSELHAFYKKNGSNIEKDSAGIWLVTRESFCKNRDASSGGCTSASDEVVIEYDYGPQDGSEANNLSLIGKRITDANQSRLTCYEYDIYGNRIGQTAPKADLNACP